MAVSTALYSAHSRVLHNADKIGTNKVSKNAEELLMFPNKDLRIDLKGDPVA